MRRLPFGGRRSRSWICEWGGCAVPSTLSRRLSVPSVVAVGALALLASALAANPAVAGHPAPSLRTLAASAAKAPVSGPRAAAVRNPVDPHACRRRRLGPGDREGRLEHRDRRRLHQRRRQGAAARRGVRPGHRDVATLVRPEVSGTVWPSPPDRQATPSTWRQLQRDRGARRRDLALMNLTTGRWCSRSTWRKRTSVRSRPLSSAATGCSLRRRLHEDRQDVARGMVSVNATSEPYRLHTFSLHRTPQRRGSDRARFGRPDEDRDHPERQADGGHRQFQECRWCRRDQVAILDLASSRAKVATGWRTRRFSRCATRGSSTRTCVAWPSRRTARTSSSARPGGPTAATPCATRLHASRSTRRVDDPPTWVAETGGDSLWATAPSRARPSSSEGTSGGSTTPSAATRHNPAPCPVQAWRRSTRKAVGRCRGTPAATHRASRCTRCSRPAPASTSARTQLGRQPGVRAPQDRLLLVLRWLNTSATTTGKLPG